MTENKNNFTREIQFKVLKRFSIGDYGINKKFIKEYIPKDPNSFLIRKTIDFNFNNFYINQ